MALLDLIKAKGIDDAEARKVVAYVNEARDAEKRSAYAAEMQKKSKPSTPVTDAKDETIANLAEKYHNLGLVLDGTNVVVTGKNMAMVTAHGYKNKTLQVYPESKFDLQLVRATDVTSFAKESGNVVYSHQINDPFGNQPIVGAYLVYENRRGQSLELLNKEQYDAMKSASKQAPLWDKWESEFWLKSVLKRAGKRHFYDAIKDIDADDNEQYGIDENAAPVPKINEAAVAAVQRINNAKTSKDLMGIYNGLGPLLKDSGVIAALRTKKAELQEAANVDQTPENE